MKFGPPEIMYIVSNAIRVYKESSEAYQLGLKGLRRNGQLAVAPLDGKLVELTPERFPWVAKLKLGDVG